MAWAVAVLGWTQRVTVVAGLGMGRPRPRLWGHHVTAVAPGWSVRLQRPGSGKWVLVEPGFQTQRPGSLERDPAFLLDTVRSFIPAAKTAMCLLAGGGGRWPAPTVLGLQLARRGGGRTPHSCP